MSLSQEAIKHIQETAIQPKDRNITADHRSFIIDKNGEPYEIKRQTTNHLKSHTLSALVEYIKNIDYKPRNGKLYLHIEDEESVALWSEFQNDGTRDLLFTTNAIVPGQNFKRFLSAEQLNIELQSKFKQNEDRDILLQVVGNIKDEAVQNTSDDGISQSVTIKQGVASVAAVKVPNPVVLTPFSTFQDVDQPERLFIFRMREGAQGALFDTDDNSWKLKAIQSIKEYFERELAEVKLEVVILA